MLKSNLTVKYTAKKQFIKRNKGQILRGTGGTKTILGEQKTNLRFLVNKGISQFISGEQGNKYHVQVHHVFRSVDIIGHFAHFEG